MRSQLIIDRHINLPEWNDAARAKVVEFWQQHGFKLRQSSDFTLEGKRGHISGNLFSFDVRKLITKLSIAWDCDRKVLFTALQVNTDYQILIDLDVEVFNTEMEIFKNFLLLNERNEDRMLELIKASKKESLFLLFRANRRQLNKALRHPSHLLQKS